MLSQGIPIEAKEEMFMIRLGAFFSSIGRRTRVSSVMNVAFRALRDYSRSHNQMISAVADALVRRALHTDAILAQAPATNRMET